MEQRTKVGEFPFARDKEEDSYKNKDEEEEEEEGTGTRLGPRDIRRLIEFTSSASNRRGSCRSLDQIQCRYTAISGHSAWFLQYSTTIIVSSAIIRRAAENFRVYTWPWYLIRYQVSAIGAIMPLTSPLRGPIHPRVCIVSSIRIIYFIIIYAATEIQFLLVRTMRTIILSLARACRAVRCPREFFPMSVLLFLSFFLPFFFFFFRR